MSQTVAIPHNTAENSFLTMFLVSFTAHILTILLFVLLPGVFSHTPTEAFGGPSGDGGSIDWVRLGPAKTGKTSLKPKVEQEAAPSKKIEKLLKDETVELKSKTTLPDETKQKEEVKPKASLNQPELKAAGPFGAGKNTKTDSTTTSGSGGAAKIGIGTYGTGNGGTGGFGTGTGVPFPFPWYVDRVIDKVDESWVKPFIQQSEGQNYQTVVYFVITKNGQVKDVRVETPSSVAILDRSAESAIYNAQPFPPLPTQWTEPDLAFRLTFQYTQ